MHKQSYLLRWKDKDAGIFSKKLIEERYTSQDTGEEISIPFYDLVYTPFSEEDYCFPIGMFDINITADLSFQLVKVPFVNGQMVRSWLESRIVPENREGIDKILADLGLNRYDMWSLIELTRGMGMEDYYWFPQCEDEKYEEINYRHLLETGQQEKIPQLKAMGVYPKI